MLISVKDGQVSEGARAAAASPNPSVADPDRTTRARIRDAALARFAQRGVGAATLKAIAADAGVSAQLIVHHFGSKEGLAAACDEHVLATIRSHKQQWLSGGLGGDLFQALRDSQAEGPLLAYLARRLADDSPQVDQLIDEALEDSLVYGEEGVRSGVLTSLARSREHAIVVLLWSLGAAVLHRHAERLLGVDILSGSAQERLGYIVPATEILAEGYITPETLAQLRSVAGAELPDDLRAPDGRRT
jgi:AcrR family transcriptional regulator